MNTRNNTLDEIDACLGICMCFSEVQKSSLIEMRLIHSTREQEHRSNPDAQLNELELGEINILCLKNCIEQTNSKKQCFQNCEDILTKLMITG
jgi:hypothetical protein